MQREAAGQTVSRPVSLTQRHYILAHPNRHKNDLYQIIYFLSFFLSYRLVSTLTLLSKKLNCYKITLECAAKNVAFYQKFGYITSDETYMQCRFFD